MNVDTITQSVSAELHHRLPGEDEALCGAKLLPDALVSKEAGEYIMQEFAMCDDCDDVFHLIEHAGMTVEEATEWSVYHRHAADVIVPFVPLADNNICPACKEELA